MASINYNKTTQLGSMTSQLINGLIQMKFLSTRLKDIVETAVDGKSDYSKIETMFGLEVGTGAEFHQAIFNISDILTKLGSLAQLDQG